jgi:hypothetical protein
MLDLKYHLCIAPTLTDKAVNTTKRELVSEPWSVPIVRFIPRSMLSYMSGDRVAKSGHSYLF